MYFVVMKINDCEWVIYYHNSKRSQFFYLLTDIKKDQRLREHLYTRRKTCPLQLLIFSCSGQVANKLQVVVVF